MRVANLTFFCVCVVEKKSSSRTGRRRSSCYIVDYCLEILKYRKKKLYFCSIFALQELAHADLTLFPLALDASTPNSHKLVKISAVWT